MNSSDKICANCENRERKRNVKGVKIWGCGMGDNAYMECQISCTQDYFEKRKTTDLRKIFLPVDKRIYGLVLIISLCLFFLCLSYQEGIIKARINNETQTAQIASCDLKTALQKIDTLTQQLTQSLAKLDAILAQYQQENEQLRHEVKRCIPILQASEIYRYVLKSAEQALSTPAQDFIVSHECRECGFKGDVHTKAHTVVCPKCGVENDFWLLGERPPLNHFHNPADVALLKEAREALDMGCSSYVYQQVVSEQGYDTIMETVRAIDKVVGVGK